ncbi:MAG: cell division protein FtsQ/DivIB [Burkholderiales bacterium]
MWDKPYVLLWLAHALYTLAALLVLYAALYFTLRLPWFDLRVVKVNGELEQVTQDELRVAARGLKGNFFTVDLDAARARFEKLPWVRGVSLRRQWPDQLEVTLEEQMPLARWDGGGLVNIHGEIFAGEADARLPLFSGPAGSSREIAQAYASFAQLLQPHALVRVQLSARRAWQVRLDNGLVLALGREHMQARLQRFVAVHARTLGELQWQPTYADLRYDNGFALRVPEAVRRAAPGKRKPA